MALQMSAPQLHGQILEPPGTVLQMTKPQGPAVQLLLWQVLQQLQSIDPNSNQCTRLVNELRMEKIRLRQERTRREDFEEEAYKEIADLRNEKKLSGINTDGIMLELQVRKSELETLGKQLAYERNTRIKSEVENEKCGSQLQQEQELSSLLGQELEMGKEKYEKEIELRKLREEDILKLQRELNEEKMSSVRAKRELERNADHMKHLEETLKNETMKRISTEHEYLKQILDLKNQISILTGLQDIAENSKKLCDVAQENLIEESDKVLKLKNELSNLRADLFKLNIELGYEKKAAVELKEGLIRELNHSKRLKDELKYKTNKVSELENEIKLARKKLSDVELENDGLQKKLEAGQIDLNRDLDQVAKLKKDLEVGARRIKELEKELDVVNGTCQSQTLEEKLQNATKDLINERNAIKALKMKLDDEAKEIADLNKKLVIERETNEAEKERRKSAEKETERVKSLYIKFGGNGEFTPLHRASQVCDIAQAKSFMRNGHSADEATKGNSTWKTAVHLAVHAGCTDLVQLFALNNTLINIWDENGATPLHEAARHPNLNVVRVLLDHGAAINAWDKFGQTPLDYAGSNGNREVMKLLLDRGAKSGSYREYGPTTESANEKDDNDAVDYNYYY